MNLGRVKTFLIVLFLGINIYLLISHFTATRFAVDSKTCEKTLEIIQGYGITVDKDIVPKYAVNLKSIDTNNIVYTKEFKKLNKNGRFKVSGDSFSCKIKNPTLSDSDANIKKGIKAFLEKSGFPTKHMSFSKTKTKDNKTKTFQINCKVKNYSIFDSVITVDITKDGCAINGKWFEPMSDDVKLTSRSRQTVYITSILVDFAQNEKVTKNTPLEITSIEYGYLSGSQYKGGGHISTTARAFYKLTDDKKNIYYYDAKEGTYFNAEE